MIKPLKAVIKMWESSRWCKKEERREYTPPPKPFHLPGWDEAYVELNTTGERIKLCDIDKMLVRAWSDGRCTVYYGLKSGNGLQYDVVDGKCVSEVTADAQENFSFTGEGIGRTLEIRIQQDRYGIR